MLSVDFVIYGIFGKIQLILSGPADLFTLMIIGFIRLLSTYNKQLSLVTFCNITAGIRSVMERVTLYEWTDLKDEIVV